MAPLVDFHDATTLLGDFTMVKSYTIDWEKTVVVYRGGHHQTVVVTNEGDALLVDSTDLAPALLPRSLPVVGLARTGQADLL